MKKALQLAGLRAEASVPESAVVTAGRQTQRSRSFHPFSEFLVGDSGGELRGLLRSLRRDLVHFSVGLLASCRSRLRQVSLRELERRRSGIAEFRAEPLEDPRSELAELERPDRRA